MPDKRKSSRVTLGDVAKAAGVSPITVSRALRNPDMVSAELRERVMSFVEQMGYVPDIAAQALASRRSQLIAVLVPAMTNYVFSEVMNGIEARVRPTDFRLLYANSHFDPCEEARHLKLFLGQRPIGVIIAGVDGPQDNSALLSRMGCPVVQIQEIRETALDMAIGFSHFDAAAAATHHLVECGYRRIALLGGNLGVRGERRLLGYRSELERHGIFDPALVRGSAVFEGVGAGAELFRDLLERVPDVDAVLCQTDDLALGVLFECQRQGRRVPDDIGVCGFNDLEFAQGCVPPLTTVQVPRYDMGYRAADMVIAARSGARPESRVDVGFQIMVRGSTKKRPT
ncbi:LacI family DNA-binding transcriptional regulator [Ciceribacter sp. L1K23]|uniref:LacI family DNA-binding transcriptional regulator n=1 Tax=Ciceribacter sp. L1K23 TaxID=2820276 RepID=UPI00201281D7|nr:LacI family DNA-binding transcriptional regulator [Ciceribacter sp. L1K23]